MPQLWLRHRQKALMSQLLIHPFHMMLGLRRRGGRTLESICKEVTGRFCFLGSINPSLRFHHLGFKCLLNFLSISKLKCPLQQLHCKKCWYRQIDSLIFMISYIIFSILSKVLQIFHSELEIAISIPNRLQKAMQHCLNALNHFQKMVFKFYSYIFSKKISD